VQPGLTQAQSAAIEAYEEAGVHGRIEEVSFLRYRVRKFAPDKTVIEHTIHAHLCEVLQLEAPPERNRNPTWFAAYKAKRRLADGRTQDNADELARVLDRAVARIRRFPARMMIADDPLLKITFEAAQVDVSERAQGIEVGTPIGRGLQGNALLPGARRGAKILQLPAPAKSIHAGLLSARDHPVQRSRGEDGSDK
jgi:hypothetical protein